MNAKWTVLHIPGAGGPYRTTAISVSGFDKSIPFLDEPSVFEISPNGGSLAGPTVSASAAIACPPNDLNRMYTYMSRNMLYVFANNLLIFQ